MKVVEVQWVDSLILDHGEWMDIRDTKAAMMTSGMLHHSVGYLVRENKVAYLIASSLGQNDRIQGGLIIPKCAVQEMKVLAGEE